MGEYSQWVTIPASLRAALDFSLEENAEQWLERAVDRASRLAKDWGFIPERVFEGGALSLVTLGTSTSTNEKTVLKVPTDVNSGLVERQALTRWAGKPVPKIFQGDDATGAFLMEYLPPTGGTISVEKLVQLWNLVSSEVVDSGDFESYRQNFAMRSNWAEERFKDSTESRYFSDARLASELFFTFDGEQPDFCLLHGDFQDKNIYFSGDRLVVLDPLPCVGPRIYDLAFWIALTSSGDPLDALVKQVANQARIDYETLLRWTWCIAATENRPTQKVGAQRRQTFVNQYREIMAGYLQNPHISN